MSLDEAFDIVYAKIRESMPDTVLGTMEKEMVQRALRETGGNQVKASSLLGITRATLRKRIDQYSIRFLIFLGSLVNWAECIECCLCKDAGIIEPMIAVKGRNTVHLS